MENKYVSFQFHKLYGFINIIESDIKPFSIAIENEKKILLGNNNNYK
jgi:hypothetical protein